MAAPLDTITYDEFERRLEQNNSRLQRELEEAQERVRQIEALIARKQAFSQRLDEMLTEIEREEQELTVAEKSLRLRRSVSSRRPATRKAS